MVPFSLLLSFPPNRIEAFIGGWRAELLGEGGEGVETIEMILWCDSSTSPVIGYFRL